MHVDEHLEAASRLPWLWGGGASGFDGVDCSLAVANWAVARGGEDPAHGIRGTYDDEAGATAWINRPEYGSVDALIRLRFTACGWRQVDAAQDGDVAVVLAPLAPLGVVGQIPAIRSGELWVIRTLRGHRASSLFEPVSILRPPAC